MKYIKLILLLSFANICYGQTNSNNIDSLKTIAATDVPDTVKFNSYLQLIPLLTDTSEVKIIFDKSFALLTASTRRQQQLFQLLQLARKLRRSDDYYRRNILLNKMKVEMIDSDSTKTIAGLYYEFAGLMQKTGQMDQSILYFNKAKDLYEKIDDQMGIVYCLGAISIASHQMGDWQNAFEHYQQSIAMFESMGDTTNAILMRYNLCDTYMGIGEVSKAINELEIGKKFAERKGNIRILTFVLSKLGSIYNSQGKYKIAKEYLDKSLAIGLEINQKTAIAEAYVSLGDNALGLESEDIAVSYYHKSLRIYEEIGEIQGVSKRLFSLGNFYLKRNLEDSAVFYFQKAFAIAKEAKFTNDHLKQLGLLGNWYLNQGKLPVALDYYFDGLTLAEQVMDSVSMSRFYLEIASVYEVQQNDSLTNQYYEKSLALSQQIDYVVGIANVKNIQAKKYLKKSDFEAALKLSSEAGALLKTSGDSCSLADSYLNIGSIYLKTGVNDSSLYYLDKSKEIASRCNVNDVLASVYIALATLYENLNDIALAIKYYENAITIGEEQTFRNVIIDASSRLHELYNNAGDKNKAYHYLQIYQTNKDFVSNAEVTREVTRKELTYQYERERALQEVEQQRAQMAQDQKIQNLRWVTFTAIGSFLAMLLIAFAFYRNYRNKQKANQLLSTKNSAIEKQKQKLQELDRSKSRFFANISHELRTPLTLISGPLEELADKQRYDESTLQLVLRNTKKLKGLVNDILDLSKLESFKLKINIQPVDIRAFISRISSNYQSMAERLEISYQYDVSESVSDWLMTDSARVEKILNNLLFNAIKYTKPGGKVNLKVIRKEETLVLQVSDTGQGIPENDLPFIFERYFQSKQPDAPIQGGTGIGLALANELAVLMDGEITVDSTVGEGSCFTLCLPYKIAVDPGVQLQDFVKLETNELKAEPVETMSQTNGSNGHKRHRILFVEDNTDMQEYVKNLLVSSYEVCLADNGKKALDALNNSQFDLIITDAMMPEMDGFSLVEQIKETDSLRPIPIIMLTALNFEQSKLKALATGVDDYLTKPFSATELLARAQNLLARYEVRRNWKNEAVEEVVDLEEEAIEAVTSLSDMDWLKSVELIIWEQLESSDFNIAILADEFHLSRRQFQRRIKKLTGMAPKQYQQEIALQKSRQLLENATYGNVTAVGYAVGINNASRFSQMYYQRFGKKPGDYFSHSVEA